jgi:proteasome lid subunit RPN8/RPN11
MLIISKKDLETIIEILEDAYPEEGCGAILGYKEGDRWSVREIVLLKNAAQPDRKRQYEIAPVDLLRLMRREREEKLSILGFFHSHPDHPPLPSETDRKAAWEGYCYPIFSIVEGAWSTWNVWMLSANSELFEPVLVRIG